MFARKARRAAWCDTRDTAVDTEASVRVAMRRRSYVNRIAIHVERLQRMNYEI